jgi:tripartite-type tricarboxylate transporter receptor subunit TctC
VDRVRGLFRPAGFAAVLLGLLPSPTKADAVEDFYRGKTLTIYVGFPPGGQYDIYARLLAKFLPAHLPGAPNVIVQNMVGAASLTAANHVISVAPQDGTALAATSAALPFQPLLDVKSAKFDVVRTNWLPVPTSETNLVSVWHTVPLASFLDARNRETVMGTSGVTSAPAFYGRIFNDVFKTKFKMVHGYAGSPEVFLAIERGEVEGHASSPWSTIKGTYGAWLKEGKIKLLLQYGDKPSPELPNVPFARDLAQSDEDKLLLDMSMAPTFLGRPYLMGPGVPAERVAAMRKAMMETWTDPMLVAEAKKAEFEVNPLNGDEVQAIINRTYNAPPPLIERLQKLYSAEGK